MRVIHHQKVVSEPRWGGVVTRVVQACTGTPPADAKDVTSWLPMVTCEACRADWVNHVLTS